MSNRELAGLACKIVGIYIMILGINISSNVFILYLSSPMLQSYFPNVIYALFYVVIGIVLWIFSDRLSSIMVREEKKVSGSEITIDSIQKVAFSVLGLYFIGNIHCRG